MAVPFKLAEADQKRLVAEGFALIVVACIGCGQPWMFVYWPGAVVPGGCLCEECAEKFKRKENE